jgi:hypothetical protein
MSFSTYKTFNVFHLFPCWADKPKEWISFDEEVFDNPLGFTYAESYQDYSEYKAANVYIANGRDKIYEINELFDTLLGRYDKLWFPSWREDVNLLGDISAVATSINVSAIDYATFYPATPGTGRYIFIYVNQSTWFCREVISFPGAEWIEIDSALGQAISTSDVKMICFLYLGRFDIDEIEWEYITPTIAKTEIHFIELPKAYADL